MLLHKPVSVSQLHAALLTLGGRAPEAAQPPEVAARSDTSAAG